MLEVVIVVEGFVEIDVDDVVVDVVVVVVVAVVEVVAVVLQYLSTSVYAWEAAKCRYFVACSLVLILLTYVNALKAFILFFFFLALLKFTLLMNNLVLCDSIRCLAEFNSIRCLDIS